ncbi:MAG: ATP-binding protein, partial [Rhodospirillales bacterium]|nr:ATP-binding protein [Rhodospirillales bacterium]
MIVKPADAGEAALRLAAREEELERLFPWLAAAVERLNISPALRPRLHLALEEAVSNIVRHGFAPRATGSVTVRLERDGPGARLVIEDDGKPFDPSAGALPPIRASLAEAQVGGSGLRLLRHACDAIAYSTSGGLNR